jgi:peptidoglycan/xylan/chitin deacetylase (PgdA/CDA1 family)
MPLKIIQHAIGLHLHQPADTLLKLLRQDESELRRVLFCYERLARHAHKYAHVARLHVALSGVLLEQLRDPAFIEAGRHLADIPAILNSLRSAPNIEFVATGYRHAPLPLIPLEDWEEQLRNERVTMESVLGRVLKGYLPPTSLFTLEMIPVLVRAGYEYVLLPNSALIMPNGHGADPYRAYRLRHLDALIDVVPWDRGFSKSQESGLDAAWFADEARNGVAQSPESSAPYLLTTWSDGDAGEWFRRMDEEQGFFGHFFSPCMEFCETGEFPVQPIHLAEYLRQHPPATEVDLVPEMQIEALVAGLGAEAQAARKRLLAVVARYWSVARAATTESGPSRSALKEARELTLQAEASDFLLGDASRREEMLNLLDRADRLLASKPAQSRTAAQPEPPKVHEKAAAQVTPTAPSEPPPTNKDARAKTGKTVQSRPTKKKTHRK